MSATCTGQEKVETFPPCICYLGYVTAWILIFFLIPSICGHPDAAVAPRGSQGGDPEAPPWASSNHQETVKRGILDAFMEPQLGLLKN